MRNVHIFMASLIFTLMMNVGVAAAQCQTDVPAIRQFLEQNREWHIIDNNDLFEENRNFWNRHHKGLCPGLSDVNMDGKKTFHAVALVKKTNNKIFEQVVIFKGDKKNTVFQVLAKPEETSILAVIYRIGPMKLFDYRKNRKFDLIHESLVLEQIEAVSVVFYYSNGKILSIQSSE